MLSLGVYLLVPVYVSVCVYACVQGSDGDPVDGGRGARLVKVNSSAALFIDSPFDPAFGFFFTATSSTSRISFACYFYFVST